MKTEGYYVYRFTMLNSMATTKIKGEYVEYEERYYFCPYSEEEENEFALAKMENDLENINMQEVEDFEYTKYHFLPNSNLDLDAFSEKEKEILHMVVIKFKEYSSADIVKYMHEEKAYTDTKDGEIIPFSLAKEIRDF